MMIPMTKFDVIDQSQAPEISSPTPSIPICVYTFASDKGPEEFKLSYGDNFYKRYGTNISFTKYGQPLMQAAQTIESGGAVLAKRVVASDATLANIGIFLQIKEVEVQDTDNKGNLIFLDPATGEETTTDTGQPKMVKNCELKYTLKTCQNKQDKSSIHASMQSFISEDDDTKTYIYPIYTICDNGRGKSIKKIHIAPDYQSSKTLSYVKYTFSEIENDSIIESLTFTLNPNVIEAAENKSLKTVISSHSNQIICLANEDNLLKAYSKIAEISGEEVENVMAYDLFFAKDKKGNDLDNIILNTTDDNSTNLSYPYGIYLQSGTNGAFTDDSPINTTEYTRQLVEFYDGTFTNDIYDLDNYRMDLIIDANYPNEVKRAIETLVIYREDVEYFQDMGLGLRSLSEILSVNMEVAKDKSCIVYHLSYDILDPYTRKQITVTIGYSLASLLVTHFLNGRTRPFAGELYGVTLTDAIEGTINFLPKVTPSYNEKQILLDNRINYASYYDNVLVVETLLTSQEEETQLSYVNNVLGIQEIIKDVRARCPKIRYSFITGDDLTVYQEDVQKVLDLKAANFESLEMVYLNDTSMITNKVFYAAIKVKFKNFVQTEYFKLYALN